MKEYACSGPNFALPDLKQENEMAIEICSGCGAEAPQHPWAGVTRDEDGKMAEFPVCHDCWANPEHRTAPLKMHFFPRGHAAIAVDAAERNILVEGA